ncbi:flavin reductase family protein [Amycolatopsis ultiminotia]|uniref:Flavin reductase family protein n=1 Tax=Amycolatopsis ultiminotia TaxID=543629 RepID=A0ABP6XHL3_9PSEU
MTAPDSALFRRAMGLFPTGVAVLSHGAGAAARVITANSLTSVSLHPLLVLISVRSDGRFRTGVEDAAGFAVHLLADDQEELAALFAARDRPVGLAAQRRLGAHPGRDGGMVVPAALAGLDCTLERQYPGGDHTIFVGRVQALRIGDEDRSPLLFHRGRFAALTLSADDRGNGS